MLEKRILSLFLICSAVFGYSQSTQPILKLNMEMHTTKINRLDTDAAGKYILTCSNDKTAKLWEANSGQLIRTFRPPIGEGNEGMLYACAISPDAQWVIVGGWSKLGNHNLYVFEASSGYLYHRITGLPNVIQDIEFSADGIFFAVGLGESEGIRIFRSSTFSLYKTDSEYVGNVNNISFAKNGRLATVSYDGYIRLYDAYFNLIKKVKPSGGERPFSLAFSPDESKLAIGFTDSSRIQILGGNDLSLLYEADNKNADKVETKLNIVTFSKDGSQLLAGGSYRKYQNDEWSNQIRFWEAEGTGSYREFKACKNKVMDIKVLPDGQIAYAGFQPDWGILDPVTGEQLRL